MSALVFPDNTVLINFAHIERMDLLTKAMNGNGRWCQSIATECDDSAQVEGLADLRRASSIFGEPWRPTPPEHISIMILRDQLASPGDPPTKHLGEAETIVLAMEREPGSRFVTDDTDARRVATAHGLGVVTTHGLLSLCYRLGWVSVVDLDVYIKHLKGLGRHLPQ